MRTLAIAALALVLGFSLMQFAVETLKSWRASEELVRVDAHAASVADKPKPREAATDAAVQTGQR